MTAVPVERTRDRWGRRLWATVIAIAAFLELRGLFRRNADDTLSEYTWSKTKNPAVRGAVIGLIGWLAYHFSYGNDRPLGLWDGVAVGLGALLGVVSAKRRLRQ